MSNANTNEIIRDSEKPAHGQQVITACALMHQQIDGETKVFVAQRAAHRKFLPGVYEIPGGHIDFGECITDGLKREVREEFGAEITLGDPFAAFDYTNPVKGSHSVEIIYFATFTSPIEQITLDPDNHDACRWIAERDLGQLYASGKNEDDEEIKALRKAFALLGGQQPSFGG